MHFYLFHHKILIKRLSLSDLSLYFFLKCILCRFSCLKEGLCSEDLLLPGFSLPVLSTDSFSDAFIKFFYFCMTILLEIITKILLPFWYFLILWNDICDLCHCFSSLSLESSLIGFSFVFQVFSSVFLLHTSPPTTS